MSRNPYLAIMRAAARGQGVHLTAAEVFDLAMDDAVETVALNSLTPEAISEIKGVSPLWPDFYARVDVNLKVNGGSCPQTRGRFVDDEIRAQRTSD